MRLQVHELWPQFDRSFGDFLLLAVEGSRYDRFAEAHFRHNGNKGYIFESDMEKFEIILRLYERGRENELTI
jgi:hypothetical protein